MTARKKASVSFDLARRRQDREHEEIMKELEEQFAPLFLHSPDGVYLYLDDNHKVCSGRLAEMFGLTVDEWREVPSFLESFVAPADRAAFAKYYQAHVSTLTRPATFRFRAVRRNGETFTAETEMIPIAWHGYPVALHFVREVR